MLQPRECVVYIHFNHIRGISNQLTLFYKRMSKRHWHTGGTVPSASCWGDPTRNSNCQHLEDIGHSRCSRDSHCHRIINVELGSVLSLREGDVRIRDGAESEGFGEDQCQRPSTEILRLFQKAFPEMSLSDDPIVSFSRIGRGNTEPCDLEWENSPDPAWEAHGSDNDSHEEDGVFRQIEYGRDHVLEVSCVRITGDEVTWDDLAQQQHDEYEVKPGLESGLLWAHDRWNHTCAPAA